MTSQVRPAHPNPIHARMGPMTAMRRLPRTSSTGTIYPALPQASREMQEKVEVYCDGGVGRTCMDDPLKARESDWVGRTAVVIPSLDYGLVAQFHDSLLLPNGHENSEYAELVAIRNADAVRLQMGAKSKATFEILSDNFGAIERSGLSNISHISQERFHYADEYLYRMMSRARYLWRTAGEVSFRRPVNPVQEEITRLMKAERLEFELSSSPLFRSFTASGYV